MDIIKEGASVQSIDTSVAALNQPLADMLNYIGLPTENVLVPIEERRKVIYSLQSTLEILPIDNRDKAFYLSKFTVAVTVGLFDGALNFLWNETVKAIREMVSKFDLQHFFMIAGTISNKYKGLHSQEDFEAVSEHDLLEICRRIGLLNDINFKRLEHVNYLRNHASSAHPNQNEITGIEMLGLLETCLKHAITAEPDHSVIQIKVLLDNIRKNVIPTEDFVIIASDMQKQPQERIDDFVLSIHGLFCDERQSQLVRDNIEGLAPIIWDFSTEDTKYQIGAKFGLYRKNAETVKKELTQSFLETVKGMKYKDEDSLVAELIEKLQTLRSVHYDWNNFYNESIHAKSISESLPLSGIPIATRKLFVKTIVVCLVGNGQGYRKGVDERALPYYLKFVEMFSVKEIVEFLKAFDDKEFVSDFDKETPDKRLRELIKHFKTKTTETHINSALDFMYDFPARRLDKVSSDSSYKEILKHIK
ncbi:hypothetical protein BBI11_04205 [Planococcus maritimus]|nr:hypothetical protein BBI11_04205 [Planococcus maritimus]